MSQSEKQQKMQKTIEHLKARNRSATQINASVAEEAKQVMKASRSRATSDSQRIDAVGRTTLIRSVIYQLMQEKLSQGEALRLLRIEVLGLKQDSYAHLVDVSRKTISDIENNRGNYSVDVMNKVFRPFGLKVGLVPVSTSLLNSLLVPPDSQT
ncbi:helix-turn-helix transcriptional regulator [Enterobacteriaceae bacterium C23F]